MYVGDTDDGSGVIHMVLEVVANAYDQHLAGRCAKITVEIAADGTITVEDDGPGFPVHGGDGLPPIDVLLTRLSTRPTVDGHRPHVHLGVGGLGLFVVNALSERFELVSVRDCVEAKTTMHAAR
jgi:DNA gyrase subunit B